MKNTLKIIAAYQTLVWSSAIWHYSSLIWTIIKHGGLSLLLTIVILWTVFFIFSLYTNICLLFDLQKKRKYFFLRYNILVNVLQAFRFVVFGFTFYMEFGIYPLIYFYTADVPMLAMRFSFFQSSVGMKYTSNDDYFTIGINLIPILIVILLYRIQKSYRIAEIIKEIEMIGR